jgi:lipopolysaccharide transport system ATP-binding protein
MRPIIEIHGLSKEYLLGEAHLRFDTVMEYISDKFRRSRDGAGKSSRRIWALRDVTFDVQRGDVVGIMGTNGSGKSTLLKILSRITDPTEGYAKLSGRSASLLEVGTGFHPDLTGRENVFLNGGILGMSKQEIRSKFDEIVTFSEVEQFIDTPVKRYSSGMYVRLAFSVAAHLEPEILIVDEALAVGDMGFQRKCFAKMTAVSKQGQTVLFVSHSMAAIDELCRSGVVLDHGKVIFAGTSRDAVATYTRHVLGQSQGSTTSHMIDLSRVQRRSPELLHVIQRIEVFTRDGRPVEGTLPYGEPLQIQVFLRVDNPILDGTFFLSFRTLLGVPVFIGHTRIESRGLRKEFVGEQKLVCEIPNFTVSPGEYCMHVAVEEGNTPKDLIEDVMRLTVSPTDYYGTGILPKYGVAVLRHQWQSLQTEGPPTTAHPPLH